MFFATISLPTDGLEEAEKMATQADMYKIEGLKDFFRDKSVQDYLPDFCFRDEAEFYKQTPTLGRLGKLHFVGDGPGRGMRQEWATEDNSIVVEITRDGEVTYIDTPKTKD